MTFLIKLTIIAALTQFQGYSTNAGNILFMHPFSSYSHRVSTQPLADALVKNGHNVTFIAPMPAQNPNPKIVDIIPPELTEFTDSSLNREFDISLRISKKMLKSYEVFAPLVSTSCEILFASKEFQDWLKTSPKIDLIIVDISTECAMALAFKLESKVILFSTVPFLGKYLDMFGLPDEALASYSDNAMKTSEMTFSERISNTMLPLIWSYIQSGQAEFLENISKKYLNIRYLPPFAELEENICLVMMCGSFIGEQPRSLPPMFVSVPGLHVKETHQPLSTELEEFINSTDIHGRAPHGFIYISLGTLVKPENLPQNILNVFINAIKAFPSVRFLWRWNGDFPKSKPMNLHLSKWFEQQDVLAHPKIRGFVFQAGRPSYQEALANGVPMITFPILGDQDYNALRLEELGVSINFEIGDVTEDGLKEAFSKILYDREMIEQVKQSSRLYKDVPMKPIETAVYWTEYVLRHDDFDHLKPVARNQSWYQRRNLDIWGFVFLIAMLFGILAILILVLIVKLLFNFVITHYFSNDKVKKL